ncbi:uncharacterized protein [Malus domestica]|uniref:uncharacterized protein n=1 Tax=Malus domestica TaxID=3750 RepID=UPI00397482D5
MGNNSSLAVLGKGNIRMEVNDLMQVITRVFYVPKLKNNLLSIGQLQEKGLAILMQHGKCSIYHSGRGLVMETEMSSNRMFIILARSLLKEQHCFNSTIEDQSQLWHRRYGHLSWNGLKVLQQKKIVQGLPQFKAPAKLKDMGVFLVEKSEAFDTFKSYKAKIEKET